MLESILSQENIKRALKKVVTNGGAAGIDRMETGELREYLEKNWEGIKAELLEGRYIPNGVREVEIPKPNGGTRKLGIPTVIDRLIQQAITQELSKIYDPEFSDNSYGFRPKKSAHQAVRKAEQYVNQGKIYVIELDLENFFDKVNHDRLMSRIAMKITDKRLLKLIRRYLTRGIMKDGVVSRRTEGTPQGSPLSPLLPNIVLDELDKELEKWGHEFVRYADDCNIYVKSKKAAERILEGLTIYIEGKLKLKVNRQKSSIQTASGSTLLGFSFY